MRALLIVVLASLFSAKTTYAMSSIEKLEKPAVSQAQNFMNAIAEAGPTESVRIAGESLEEHKKRPNPCKAINEDEVQKAEIQAAVDKFKSDSATQIAEVKKAYSNLSAVLKDPNSEMDAAVSASDAMNAASDSLRESVQSLKLEVLYKVLKPEQRSSAVSCMVMMMHHKAMNPGHNGHHGHHPAPPASEGDDTVN